MHEGALRSLEFDRIVEVVQGFALTPLGAARLAQLHPLTDPREVQAALAATSECVRYVESNQPLALQAPADLDAILTSLAIEGLALEPVRLRGLADFLSSVDCVHRAVARAHAGPFPALRAVLEGCRSFEGEISQIRDRIDDTGHVVDHASPQLRTIRDRLRKQSNRLRGTLDSYLRGKDTARYLQDQIVTDRGGRYVLVIKTEHRDAIPGIVHGSSGSGASLFLEPLSTVEINNDIVALQESEAAEVRRILVSLANTLRTRAADLRNTITAAAEIDDIQARAAFSRLVDGVAPELTADTRMELLQARHPLLIPEVRTRLGSKGSEPATRLVPVDVRVTPPTSALVITGPNTGGKTVALKTAGLLSLMAQAGLHVPAAAGSRIVVFRTVFADIGDEQSITASLSTFSGHIKNIVAMDQRLRLPALVLLDEVGAGTDPVEGGALGAALIEHFRGRGALVVATTHDDMLKSYAATTDGVACAGFGFDPDTFAPSYQLTYGSPGRSLALEIAARLGVPPAVIQTARERRSAHEAQLAKQLAKVDEALRGLDDERQQFEAEREHLASERAELEAGLRELREQKAGVRQRLAEGINDQVRSARAEIDAVVDGLRTRASQLERAAQTRAASGQTALSTGEIGTLRAGGHTALSQTVRRARQRDTEIAPTGQPTASAGPKAAAAPPRVGSRVTIGRLRLDGHVLAVHDDEAEVEVRGKRLRVPVANLHVVDGTDQAPDDGGHVTLQLASTAESLQDLNVIGCTVDEALSRTEKYLDQATLHEQRQVRVIHGYGTGVLRRSIADLLANHPQVARFAPARREHGGGGVTVVELKE